MESMQFYVPIESMSKLKYGLSVQVMKLLERIGNLDVDWLEAGAKLKNVTYFNRCSTNESYATKIFKAAFNTNRVKFISGIRKVEKLDEISLMYHNFLLSYNEVMFLIKLYQRFIDEAISNKLDYKVMFDISFNIPMEEALENVDGDTELEKLNRLVKIVTAFWKYNQFAYVAVAISIGLNDGKKVINYSFIDEITHYERIVNSDEQL